MRRGQCPRPLDTLTTTSVRCRLDFLEGLGPSNREDVVAKRKKGGYPKPNAILVFVDSFTRYTKLFPVFDKSADTVRRCLHKLFCELGIDMRRRN